MTPTTGRGDYATAIWLWPWRDGALYTREVAHRLPVGFTPTWIAVVPSELALPDILSPPAHVYALRDDTVYVW